MPLEPSNDDSTSPRRKTKIDVPLLQRAALKPTEFDALFGRQAPWTYRQIYAGRVRVIPGLGRLMIPQSEVTRLMGEAVPYVGKPSKPRQKKKSDAAVHAGEVANA